MSLTVDDIVSMVEAAAILVGIAITWAVYRGSQGGLEPCPPDSDADDRGPRASGEGGP